MKVLITGGAGYLGSELTRLLARRDDIDPVLVYDNLSRGNHNLLLVHGGERLAKASLVRGDILDSRRLRAVLKDVDVVFHLAARVTTPFSDRDAHLFEQANHWGTAELVAAIEDSGVARLVFVSSAAVYGYADAPVDTRTPPNPKTYYAESKLRAERQCERLAQRLSLAIVRSANVYGFSDSMRFDAVINRFMIAAHLGEPMTVQGSGTQVRPFVHVDTAAASLAALVDPIRGDGLFDLVEQTLSINEITEAVRTVYPETDSLYIAQHIEARHLRVNQDLALNRQLGLPQAPLTTHLADFAARLALAPAR
jgi:UDP-glucose 4-epimerase